MGQLVTTSAGVVAGSGSVQTSHQETSLLSSVMKISSILLLATLGLLAQVGHHLHHRDGEVGRG